MLVGLMMAVALGAGPEDTGRDVPQVTFTSGNDLWATCGFTTEGFAPAPCRAYVTSVYDTLAAAYWLGPTYTPSQQQMGLCAPAGVVGSQLTDVVRAYLKDHPESRDQPGAYLVIKALRERFPCAT